jgi:tungstate transport system substrate-binding protein
LVLAAACGAGNDLILATTTSTRDTGLLDVLVPRFEELTGYHVKTIAVGSGQALRLGQEGEADVILAHSPDAENAFVAAGHGLERLPVMQNDFVVVGPANDPAGIAGFSSAAEAMARIAERQAVFLSRGDESGTHAREQTLWDDADIAPSGSWYQETGQGMGQTLRVAADKRAYTLSDRGTYIVQRSNLDLEVMVESDPDLFNVYSVIAVSAAKHSRVNAEGARAFAEFVTSPDVQALIAEFGVEEYGEPLFVPNALAESTPSGEDEG